MITVAAIIPVALVAGSLIGVLLNARLASRRQQEELRGPQLDEFVQSAFQALRELRIRSELTAKLNDHVDRAHGANWTTAAISGDAYQLVAREVNRRRLAGSNSKCP
jgi:hypothetical protein